MSDLKRITKRFMLALAFIPALPLIVLSKIGSVCGSDDFFSACGCFLALLPGKTGSYLRLAYYKGTLTSISPDVFIGFGSYFSKRESVVGKYVNIGSFCILGLVTLGDRVLVASRVSIPSGLRQHSRRYDMGNPSEELTYDRVTIGSDCWIGEGAIVMADLGERCIVSAGSVITRAMPPGRLIAGNPSRVLPETPVGTGT
ncbi:MAG: acyltransferase [Pedobacter sp.]